MIIQLKHVNPKLSIGSFNGLNVEIKNEGINTWNIYVNGEKVVNNAFPTREKAIRRLQESAEKIILDNMTKVVAVQRPLSPRPTNKKYASFGNKRK